MDVEKWSEAVRPLVTAVVVATFCGIAAYLVWIHAPKMTTDQVLIVLVSFTSFVTLIANWWFKSRDDAKANEQAVNTMKAISGTGTGEPKPNVP